jgi:hypothetical protein
MSLGAQVAYKSAPSYSWRLQTLPPACWPFPASSTTPPAESPLHWFPSTEAMPHGSSAPSL